MKEKIRVDLKRYINKRTSKRPMIFPVILEARVAARCSLPRENRRSYVGGLQPGASSCASPRIFIAPWNHRNYLGIVNQNRPVAHFSLRQPHKNIVDLIHPVRLQARFYFPRRNEVQNVYQVRHIILR
jgi:hypothetical protein